MQDCFRKFPEIYGSELADDDDEAPAQETAEPVLAELAEQTATPVESKKDVEEILPKKATDATDANKDANKTKKQ